MRGLAISAAFMMVLTATDLHAQAQHAAPGVPGSSAAPTADDRISAEIMMHELRSLGYAATTDADESGDPRVNTAVDGHKWQIYFYDCDTTGALEQRRCNSFQFFTDNDMPRPVPTGTIIRWNKETTYAKAYLQQRDQAGCEAQSNCAARIEVDVLTAGTGADPAQTFRVYFAIFKQRVVEFRRAIGVH